MSYETVTVGAGDTVSLRARPGDPIENVLIDISASGAGFNIRCSEGGSVIRNVGIAGHFDDPGNDSMFNLDVRDNVGEPMLVENVHFEGYHEPVHARPGAKVWSHALHAGHITFRNVTLANLGDAGFYCSESGLPPDSAHPNGYRAGNGTYRFENCHVTGCGTGHFRVTSDGSEIINSFAADGRGANRGLYQQWGRDGATVYVRDSTIMDHSIDLSIGGSDWGVGNDIYTHVTDARWDSERLHSGSNDNGHIVGDGASAGAAAWLEPSDIGAPSTPEQAASGDVDYTPPDDPDDTTFDDPVCVRDLL